MSYKNNDHAREEVFTGLKLEPRQLNQRYHPKTPGIAG
jgi:hypothetical protein